MANSRTALSMVFLVIFLAGCGEQSKQKQVQPRNVDPYASELTRLIASTREPSLSTYDKPGLIFKYGIGCWNIYNSFAGSYTMLADSGEASSVRLRLSANEIDSIIQMMRNVGFFGFPDTFFYTGGRRVSFVAGSGFGVYFGVRYEESGKLLQKELWWIDHRYSGSDSFDERAFRLRQLTKYVRSLLENKPEVKQMSRPRRFQRID